MIVTIFNVFQIGPSLATMKTSNSAPKTSAREECGVWLDTTQLKGRAKQVTGN